MPFQDGSQIPVRYPMPKQILRLPQLVPKCAACGELDLVGLLRQRCEHGAPREGIGTRRPRDRLRFSRCQRRRRRHSRSGWKLWKLADQRRNGRLRRKQREHRRKRALEVELALIDFAEMKKELSLQAPRFVHEIRAWR